MEESMTKKSLNPLSRVNCILITKIRRKKMENPKSLNPLSRVNCILMGSVGSSRPKRQKVSIP